MTDALRVAGFGLLALALVVAVAGTGGFSSATADRGVAVDVADDASAYVGYDAAEPETVYGGNESALVTVTNRLPVSVSITDVDVDAPAGLDVHVTDSGGEIQPGAEATIVAAISCEETIEDAELLVTVSVDGDNVSVTLFGDGERRTVTVSCEPVGEEPQE